MRYCVLDPTGNITALVEDTVTVGLQPGVARAIMCRHPKVEQVGFVSSLAGCGTAEAPGVRMRMAGGEFCGNATMSTAALAYVRGGVTGPATVWLEVSGAKEPVRVDLGRQCNDSLSARVLMPQALGIEEVHLAFEGMRGTLPLVRMEGISHLVVEETSPFFALLHDRPLAEQAVRVWCAELGADGLGCMFLSDCPDGLALDPLVFVPGGDTVFWENSCASGSAAVGMYLADKAGAPRDVSLREPGGSLLVQSDPTAHVTWLEGSVRLVGEYDLPVEDLA